MNRETIFAALTRVVEKHLPMSKREAPAGFEFRTLSELWASKLISADVNDTDTFQVSNDIEKLREVASLVKTEYVDPVKPETKFPGAYSAMLSTSTFKDFLHDTLT